MYIIYIFCIFIYKSLQKFSHILTPFKPLPALDLKAGIFHFLTFLKNPHKPILLCMRFSVLSHIFSHTFLTILNLCRNKIHPLPFRRLLHFVNRNAHGSGFPFSGSSMSRQRMCHRLFQLLPCKDGNRPDDTTSF